MQRQSTVEGQNSFAQASRVASIMIKGFSKKWLLKKATTNVCVYKHMNRFVLHYMGEAPCMMMMKLWYVGIFGLDVAVSS